MPSDNRDTSPDSVAEWVKSLFDELHDPQVLAVVLKPGIGSAIIECRGTGLIRSHKFPEPFIAGVLAKMKKLANLDVAERRRKQCGRVRLLDFHGRRAGFEVSTDPAGKSEIMTLRRL